MYWTQGKHKYITQRYTICVCTGLFILDVGGRVFSSVGVLHIRKDFAEQFKSNTRNRNEQHHDVIHPGRTKDMKRIKTNKTKQNKADYYILILGESVSSLVILNIRAVAVSILKTRSECIPVQIRPYIFNHPSLYRVVGIFSSLFTCSWDLVRGTKIRSKLVKYLDEDPCPQRRSDPIRSDPIRSELVKF